MNPTSTYPAPGRRLMLLAGVALLQLLSVNAQSEQNASGPAITYVDSASVRHILFFTSSGNLKAAHLQGASKSWEDHGLSAGSTHVSAINAITYKGAAGSQSIHVFAVDNLGRLVRRYRTGAQWGWTFQNGPALEGGGSALSVVTYPDPNGTRKIYVFGIAKDTGHLVVNYWDGEAWHWADNGIPENVKTLTEVQALSYLDDQGKRRFAVFCAGYLKQSIDVSFQTALFINSWSGSAWSWKYYAGNWVDYLSPVTYPDAAIGQMFHAFQAEHTKLLDFRRQMFGWVWTDLGASPILPSSDNYIKGLRAVTYLDNTATRQIHVFIISNNRIYDVQRDGGSFNWIDRGKPPSNVPPVEVAPVTYLDSRGGLQHIYVFLRDIEQRYFVRRFDGSAWDWIDLGKIP